MRFFQDGQFIILCANRPALPAPVQYPHITRLHKTKAILEMLTLQAISPTEPDDTIKDLPSALELELALLLHTYKSVFDSPKGLPPDRSQNHSIPLIKGVSPNKVCPYR